MSAPQPTPGPWSVAPAKGSLCAWRIEADDNKLVAFVAQTGSNETDNANAVVLARSIMLLDEATALAAECERLRAALRAIDARTRTADTSHARLALDVRAIIKELAP